MIHFDEKDISMNKQDFVNELSLNQSIVHLNTITSKQFYKPSYQNEFLSKIFENRNGLSPVEYLNFERDTETSCLRLYPRKRHS